MRIELALSARAATAPFPDQGIDHEAAVLGVCSYGFGSGHGHLGAEPGLPRLTGLLAGAEVGHGRRGHGHGTVVSEVRRVGVRR